VTSGAQDAAAGILRITWTTMAGLETAADLYRPCRTASVLRKMANVVPVGKSNSDILVMKSAEKWRLHDAASGNE